MSNLPSFIDPNVAGLHTEQRNPDTIGIDKQDSETIARWINREDHKVAGAVEKVLPEVGRAIDLLYERLNRGGRMIYVGAGTSARLAYMDAAECPPTYGTDYDMVSVLMAGGRECVFRAQEHMEDSEENAVADLKAIGLCEKDVVVAATASGRTPYCVAALHYAEEIGAGRIGIACNPGSAVGAAAEVAIEPDTGAEAIMGSTRMKAGTAQKMVMNMLSTGVMIRLGRTYDNLLVGLKADNSKIATRSVRRLAMVLGTEDLEYAHSCMEKAHGSERIALMMERYGISYERGAEIIEQTNGDLRKALQMAKGEA